MQKPAAPKPATPPAAKPKPPTAPSPKPEPTKPAKPKPQPAAPEPVAPKPEKPRPEKPKPKPRPKPVRPEPVRPEQFAWAFPEEPPPGEAMPLTGAPAVDATGRIFIHLHGKLIALEEKDARPEVVWEYVTGSRAPGPVVVDSDGILRLHCTDGMLHCLNFDGKQVYPPAPVGEPLGYAAPVADLDGNTWISAAEGGLTKVDAEGRSSSAGRYFRTRQKFDAAGVIHRGVLYIGSEDGYVFAVELGDRKGKNLWNHAAEQGYTGWYIHSSPAITTDGNVVVAGRDEHVYGFGGDGKPLWKTPVPGQMLASPVIDRHGHVYVGVSQSRRGQKPRGLLLCMDGNSHKVRWQYDAAAPVESTPGIGDDDVIYLGDNAGVIHAVDFAGKPQWTAKVGAAVRSAGTIIAPGRVAFGLDDATLIALNCSSQSLADAGWPKIAKTLGQCGLV